MFRTEALRQRIELINHLVEFGRQVILIQGPAGFGKTTLLDAIEESAEPGWILIRFSAGPTLNNDSLLEKISVNLDFEPTEKFSEEEVCDEIYRRLEILQKSNQAVVVIIDEAHELPAETHPLLLRLAHNDEAVAELRVILAADSGDTSLLDSLQSNSAQSAPIHTVDIPRMDREQTASLLSWWQDQQDSPETPNKMAKFSSSTIDEIHADSAGVPGDILTLARQYRLSGANTQLRADPVKKYIGIGVIAFLLVLVFSFFGKDADPPKEQLLDIELPEAVTQPDSPAGEDLASAAPGSVLTASNDETPTKKESIDLAPANNLDKKLGVLDEPATQAPLSNSGGLEDMLSAQLAEGVLPGRLPEPLSQEENPDILVPEETSKESQLDANPPKLVGVQESQDLPIIKPDRALTAAKPATTVKAQTDTPNISVKIRSQSDPAPKIAATKPPETHSLKRTNKRETTEYSLAKLLRESPDGYVLQLFGVRNHDAADKYRKKHGITLNSAVVASMHEGSPWYVVVYGQYESRQGATKAIPDISKKLPNVKPWPRPVSSLK